PEDHSHVHRWEPWVRSYLCAQVLSQGLSFKTGGGTGKAWSVTMTTALPGGDGHRFDLITMVRPEVQVFERQLQYVMDWADLREERMPEVLTQMGNTLAFWGTLVPLHTERMRRTRELIEAAVQFAMVVEMRFKHELACWRPTDLSAQIQPMIATPGHGSLPSGHCTEAYAVNVVLQCLLEMHKEPDASESLRRQFDRTAERISTNRVVAGVHFPIDNVAGRLLGSVLGRYFCVCCGREVELMEGTFDASKYPGVVGQIEFLPEATEQLLDESSFAGWKPSKQKTKLPRSVLHELWDASRDELVNLGYLVQ
ncbi:MAG TPA: phosphatase PAP2 family protein, partial [Variovorax sp.]|nr:phosphatase PAP2 family protein [Variovorax sp.]